MACPFCATGQGGLTRNLSTAEIVDQAVQANADEIARGTSGASPTWSTWAWASRSPTTAGCSRSLRRRSSSPSPHGLGMSQRNIVVSTVGLVPAIRKLTDEGLQVTLALSLHAPDDELRDTLVPVNTRWPVREVLEAAFGYVRATGRRLSIEYALIRDVNDQPWRADLLAKRLKGKLVHVNLIPLNPTPGLGVGRLAEAGRAGVRPPAAGRRRQRHRPRHPRPRDRRRLRPARCPGVTPERSGQRWPVLSYVSIVTSPASRSPATASSSARCGAWKCASSDAWSSHTSTET